MTAQRTMATSSYLAMCSHRVRGCSISAAASHPGPATKELADQTKPDARRQDHLTLPADISKRWQLRPGRCGPGACWWARRSCCGTARKCQSRFLMPLSAPVSASPDPAAALQVPMAGHPVDGSPAAGRRRWPLRPWPRRHRRWARGRRARRALRHGGTQRSDQGCEARHQHCSATTHSHYLLPA